MIPHKCPHPYHQAIKRRAVEKYAAISVVVAILLAFVAGALSVKSAKESQIENARLESSVNRLSAENKALLKTQDFIESSKKIDVQASKESRRSLTKLHGELSVVKEQLAFYQRVVAPETLVKGVYISSFELTAGKQENHYHYQLVVAQNSNKKRAMKGRYALLIKGLDKGEDKTLTLNELAVAGKKKHVFSFRYYEILTGDIKLPLGFKPESLVVTLTPSGKKEKGLKQQWLWQELVKLN